MTAPSEPHDPVAALAAVNREIASACHDCGRSRDEVTLVAVSKTLRLTRLRR